MHGANLPFDVNVAHFLTADANVVQDDVTGVPDDATQEEPESHIRGLRRESFHHWRWIIDCVCRYFFALRGVMLNGGPGGPRDLGNKSTHIIRRPWGNNTREQSQTEEGRATHRPYYLFYLRLQRAVQRPCLHMLRDQSHTPQNVKGQLLFHRAKVTSERIFGLWSK